MLHFFLISVGSKKVTSYYYGGSNDPLYVDVYKLPNLFGLTGYLTVTAPRPPATGCIPIGEGLFGNIGQSTFELHCMKKVILTFFQSGQSQCSSLVTCMDSF